MSTREPEFPDHGCAVLFGATGGIGAATAALLAERGCNVVLTYRSSKDAAEDAAEAIRDLGRRADALACDTTERPQVQAVIDAALARYDRVHTVVSATGLLFPTGPLVDFSDEDFAGVLDTDVRGFFNIAKAAVPAMRAAGGGSITALTTPATERAFPFDGLSATPKAAVKTMVRLLAAEEGRHGIRVNAVGPGVVNDAGMVLEMRKNPHSQSMLERGERRVPLRRYAQAGEIAEAIAFLASTRASYITGQRLMVDGGMAA